MAYPTGVESHGETLRIEFMYKGVRTRESLAVVDTPRNRKLAGDLQASVCYAIKTGSFNNAASRFALRESIAITAYLCMLVVNSRSKPELHRVANGSYKCADGVSGLRSLDVG